MHRAISLQTKHRALAQYFYHPVHERCVILAGHRAGILLAVTFPIHWRGNSGFECERAGHADDASLHFRPVHQHFLGGRLVVGDAFERYVRDDAADFLAFAVLFSFIDKAASGPALLVLQFEVKKRGGQEALPRQGQRHAAGINGNPAPTPLLGHVSRRSAPARRI